MNDKQDLFKEYVSRLMVDFDESTLISPNLNGEKENGKMKNIEFEIKKDNLVEFTKSNSISINELLLASLTLTLNKFNFSDKILIFNQNNVPLSIKSENRQISIREFLKNVCKNYDETLKFNEHYDSDDFTLKPEFYYSFGENLKSSDEYSNFLNFVENNSTISLSLLYNNELYTTDFIEIFLRSFEKILNQIVNVDIDKTNICDIALEGEKEIKFSEIDLPIIHKRFEKQVDEKPDEIALVATDATLTYKELNEKANRIANALIKKGVKPKSNVLGMLPRNSNLIATIIGILKAGCTFVPLDLEYPIERIQYIYENSQADYIITEDATTETSINIHELLKEENIENPNVNVSPDDLAYMIYTSGSTGNPKGVMIRHRNICNLVDDYPKTHYDRLLSMTTISFDVAMEDIFTSLTGGVELIFADDVQIKNTPELVKLINEHKPEVMDLTPSRLAAYLEVKSFCEAIKDVKCIFLGGEKFSASVFTELQKYNNHATVYNSYGPTETTITSNNKVVTDIDDLTVGRPVKNYITDVRDIDGKLLPQGVMGELYIGGPGVGKGYYNLDDKTKEVFLTINGIPYYKSGDYAIETPNGEIDIKGRVDNQIKLRGLRIEIGEIESNIGKYPSIKQNTVVIKEINGTEHLCAYFTAEEDIDTYLLKRYLENKLTKYMIPSVFMQLDEMPQTPNGKTDLKQLPEPELKLSLTLPETETEETLFEIASSIADSDKFGTTDDLYVIGFTSLSLMKFNAIIYEELGVNLNIMELLNNPTIKEIAKQIDNQSEDAIDLKKIIESSKDMEYFPLTENQLGVYYECIQSKHEAHYNLPSIIRFDKDVNAEKLKEAIIKTIESYPYLKTRIVNENGSLMQKRDDSIPIEEIQIVNVDEISDDEIEKENVKTFELENSQLFRFKIYKTNAETILFSDIHHIITDGESLDKLFNNIANAYENRSIEKESIDGYINSLMEKEHENSKDYQLSKEYFQDKLSKEVDSTILTHDLNGNEESGVLKSISRNISPEDINEFCSSQKISPNVLVMASTILTLDKYTFSDKTLITTIFNGRANSNYFNTQAFLVKTLPIVSINENRNASIAEFIKSIDEIWKETINHSNYPYTKISEEFQLKPEFLYTYNNLDDEKIKINNKDYRVKYLDTIETNYKIIFDVNESKNNLEFLIQYNDHLYSQNYLETFMDSVLNTVQDIIDGDINKLKIKDIELNKTYEIPKFTPVETPILHKRFEKQVIEKPDEIALVAADSTLTYAELNEKANRIANALIKKGVKPENNILIMLPRTSDIIASILGILKAGCAFIPIDLEYPIERITYIYENSQADYIITNKGDSTNNLDINQLLGEENTANPNVDISSDDLAYMIYTSGSTGNPKGVMISHKNACNEVESNPKCEYNNLLSIATIAFDTSLEDILTGLTNGIKIIFANDEEIKNVVDLTNLIKTHKPEVMEFTPSRLLSYLEVPEFCEVINCAKCIVMGGEQFSAKAFDDVIKYTDAKIYNSYGPTEATIASNYKQITDSKNITVGPALKNYVTEVRDIDGKKLPDGVMGELYIGGEGVGKGYYNLPEKTKEVFLTINDIPYYRSGDYAIALPDDDIDIKGRIDNQIKLRGLRIEIGEIESNITRFPNIQHAVVIIKEINNTEHLCAYFTSDEKIDTRLLRRYLENKLTKYMVPSVFMQLDKIPQTPNGKIDIKQLPAPELDLEFVKPETETEEKIFKIVSGILEDTEFGITDDLYNLGFSSLTLMKLNSMIYNETEVNIDVKSLFSNPTVQSLADKVDNNINADIDIDEIIDESKGMQYFPLTSNQLGIYYECIQTDKIKYTLPYVIRFGSDIDADKLKKAITSAINAHPYLKTRIVNVDGELKQKRCDDAEIDEIEIIEIDSISNKQLAEREIKAIPIENNQLFRFKIYKTPDETILFSDFHHIITDGESQSNFFKDVEKAYNGEEINAEKIDGYVYSLIDEKTAVNEISEKFFKNQITDGIESTVLTPNLKGNPESGEMKLLMDTIDSTFIRHFCNDHSISPNVLFMAATIIGLNKFTFTDTSLITAIFNGRASSDVFETQGMLVKTIPIIVKSENRKMYIEDFIKIVDKSWKDTLVHSNYPYTKLSEDYQLKPEFFYAFHQEMDHEIININGNAYDAISLDDAVGTDYKINFDVYDDGENISLYIAYNDQLYTEEYVKEFLTAIKYILFQFFVNDMDKLRLSDIELLNSFDIPVLEELTNPIIHKRFEKHAEVKGDEVALVATDSTLTYKELNEKANRIANALIKNGVKPKSNVLAMLPRDSNLIATIIAILKAGCTFVPLDLEYPQDRIDYIYENSQADYIINTSGDSDNSLNIFDLIKEENSSNPDVDVGPDDLAYMIYTSGSTGKPKGVMISHENACNQTEVSLRRKYDSILCIATISFDVSLEDILTSITNGITLIFADDTQIKNVIELTRLIEENKPQVIEFTPSRLLSYLEFEEFCDTLKDVKCIIMGGEQFSTQAFTEVKKYTDAPVFNSYGPTETTITSNYVEITDVDKITIGKALPNYIADVRDIDGKLLPDGVMGELYIGGLSVGKGYYNLPEKTQEVFLEINDIPYYRTGDYAIKLPDEDIEIKGRIDNQIKLRGLRIEIGEIEYNINQFPNIKKAVVLIKKINGNDHLCAYFTADEEINIEELKEYLKDRLTQYMVPTAFMQIDEIPETPSGKVDTKLLPDVNVDKLKADYVAPTTKTEELVVNAFEKVFDQEKIGIDDDFLVLGGDSLSSIKIISLLSKEDISVTVNTIMSNRTPREIARVIDGGESDYGFMLAKKGNIDQNMFFIPPISGTSFLYLYLIENLEFDGNVYVIDDYKYTLTLEEMKKTDVNLAVDKYYEALTKLFKDGDIIAGYSQGCIFTIMLASKLEQNHKIDKVILIDGDLDFKETDQITREHVMELIDLVASTDFDLEELSPEPMDIFTEKLVAASIVNSTWDFEPVVLDSHVIYLGTDPTVEHLDEIAPDSEFVYIEADHVSIVEKDVPKIIKYFK